MAKITQLPIITSATNLTSFIVVDNKLTKRLTYSYLVDQLTVALTESVGTQGIQGNTGTQGPAGPPSPPVLLVSSTNTMYTSTGSHTFTVNTSTHNFYALNRVRVGYSSLHYFEGSIVSVSNNRLNWTVDADLVRGGYVQSSSWTIVVTGEVGPQGDTSYGGPAGPAGPTGSAGVSGERGLIGATGARGLTGFSGYSGINGTSGYSGLLGNTGPVYTVYRSTATTTTDVLSSGTSTTSNVNGFSTYALLSVATNYPAQVTIYANTTSRAYNTGIIATAITTAGSLTQLIAPAIVGFNYDSPTSSTIYMSVVNNDEVSRAIDVTLTLLKLES